MNEDDNERIAKKAHELWEAEGRPHGRDQDHWDSAKEIIALHDSQAATLLPRDTGSTDAVEEMSVSVDNEGQAPGLTDTGEHDLTAIEREPAVTQPPKTGTASPKATPKLVAGDSGSAKAARKSRGKS